MDKIICPLSQAAQSCPQQTAVLFGPRAVSYQQLDQYVGSTVKYLKKIGLRKGDKLAVMDHNRVEYLIVILAAWRFELVVCPINIYFPVDQVYRLLSRIQCDVLLTALKDIYKSARISQRKFRLDEVINFDVRDMPLAQEPFHYEDGQETTLVFSSGSSGDPKAAIHTYGNHYFSALGSNQNIPVARGDRWLLSVPLYHVSGLGIILRTFLGEGTIVFPTNDELADDVAKYSVTHLSLVATQLYRLLEKNANPSIYGHLKSVLVGGGFIPECLVTKALEWKLPIYLTYGLTEMSSQVATSRKPLQNEVHPELKILPYRNLKISTAGEILVSGPTLFKGYFDGGRIHRSVDQDGYFATGDLGRLDEQGHLCVFGRRDRMFISGGENIQPEEIEKTLLEMREIQKAIAGSLMDEKFGARPVAVIQTREGHPFDPDRITDFLEKRLARFKIPREFYEWPAEIPGLKDSPARMQKLLQEGKLKKIS